ncbi:Cytochrome oxidase Cu insertion factor, SCO1/SenC/PrrC family [Pseudomonas reinekei]|jgi:cytochrome oxidase Cu insertion factor (SCO1/SenC/PrrC family)|uniref:C-type cytochrome n=1 Tax=Pseudomonas reinekei TaxID=395598 RepID=A0A1H0HWF5_PSERE|nr:SCO family protein [Pseudomonas reinekei]KAB0486985.1 c-type cytochrome [Pseudomonas reinekei]OLU04026.1 electron transporter SenC [Pseudomonas reinekei]SDO23474.1 Cytochrome oxidase Cu insertion factor, SCO1/SenC/PrrC family [Pseudomonas reinekei]
MVKNLVSTRSRALGMHLVLVLSVCLLASQLLVAKPVPPTPVPAKDTAVADTATPWGADYFPNTLLTDQDGRQVRFFDDLIKGKVVVINFIFTSCSDSCPLETARLRQVQTLLGDRVGKDVFFYSISIDPLSDTPAVLKAYAQRFQVGSGWRFLTGEFADVTELRQKLGLFIEGVDNGRSKDHNLSLIVGNQSTGRWMKASPFENPWILADQLANTLQNWKQPSVEHSYANAPAIRAPSNGEELFRTRCASCHSLGPQDGQGIGLRSIGPDLIGVTRQRDPAWLSRWIREPDRMLAQKDPIALELFERFDKIPMPNLRMDEHAAQSIIEFLQAQTDRQHPPTSALAAGNDEPEHQHASAGPAKATLQ